MTVRNQRQYDECFKLQVLSDYYSSGLSKSFIIQKWGISLPTFLKWEKLWPIASKELSLPDEIICTYRMGGKDRGKTDEQILQDRIAELERSLALERHPHRRREAEALPEQDSDQLRACTAGGR